MLCGQVAMFSELNTHNLERCAAASTLKLNFQFSPKIAKTYCTKISTSFFHFDYRRLRTMNIWNIITFLLVMVVWLHNWKVFWSLHHTELWLLSFPSLAFCSLLHISTGHVHSMCDRKVVHKVVNDSGVEGMMDVLNYLMKIMIM